MKKIFTLLTVMIPLLSMAQPTLTQPDLPYPGVAWTVGTDTLFTGPIPAGGANQVWNFSSLVNSGTDTTGFRAVTGTPYAGTFPSATCTVYDASSGQWQYFTANSTGFYFNGGNSNGMFLNLNPPWQYVPVPFTYNNNSNTYARMVIDTSLAGYPAKENYYIANATVADGWGQLSIPSGTFANVLREKVTTIITDSVLVDFTHTGNYSYYTKFTTQQVTYRWFRHTGNGVAYLMEIDADSAGTTAKKSQYFIQGIILSENDLSAAGNSLQVYPNPASTNVRFNLDGSKNEHAVLKVYNALGEEIVSHEVKDAGFFDLAVDKFNDGIYYYSLVSDNEKRSGKFSVAH